MEVVRELAKTKTVLFISHRLANVTASDCIYMMENGMISESGTHETDASKWKLRRHVPAATGFMQDQGVQRMKRRNGLQIMGKLIGLVRPLLHVMLGAILLGVAGYLCAIFLTVLAGMGILKLSGFLDGFSLPVLFAVLGTAAVLRGVLHYGEQACNHYIAFKLLALIRHQSLQACDVSVRPN